jgi:hypothetical protein
VGRPLAREALAEARGTMLRVATVVGSGAVRLLYPVAAELVATGPTDTDTRRPSGGTP